MSQERRHFDKQAARSRCHLRHEWVSLDCGDLCVREMTAAEATTLAERSQRPAIDPRGGLDTTETVLWQVLLSCYQDDTDTAERVFAENAPDIAIIMGLRLEEFQRLMVAINRVNGRDATEIEVLRDFSAMTQGEPTLR